MKCVDAFRLAVFVAIFGATVARAAKSDPLRPKTEDKTRKTPLTSESHRKTSAPEFPPGMQWLNAGGPLSLKGLRGKVVLLDFWTYCCINCMHILPDLKRLEHKYRNELVVVGVHSAKFTAERETDNIRQAILRYEIGHPVINDKDMVIWRQYNVRSWPTLYLIDPLGNIVGCRSGEGVYEPFDQLISKVIREFDRRGLVNRKPITFDLERDRAAASLLSFPGKVLADGESKRLFIADSNHNRIVVTSLDGTIQEVIGSGMAGLDDGSFETATFDHPQGMAVDGNILYVADTENHAIRRVDREKRAVTTLAGTGKQARRFNVPGMGTKVALNSPSDLVLHNGQLYIAMAGSHQLWKMNLNSGVVSPYAGSGREARIDGLLRQAALAQPSGITTDGEKLYVADSELSSIRTADLDPNGRVETLVGLDLFVFGDRDGTGAQARLQHPLGIAYHDGVLYVADTYNNKIKQVFPGTGRALTFLGTGEAGLCDGDSPLFDEPGGVSVADGNLYIADTNNHVIRVAQLKTRKVSTLKLTGIEKLRGRMPEEKLPGETVVLEPQTLATGRGTLTISLQLPDGYKLTAEAPSSLVLSVDGKAVTFEGEESEKAFRNPAFPLTVPLSIGEGEGHVRAQLVLYHCKTATEGLCYFKEVQMAVPVKTSPDASTSEIKARYDLRRNP